MFKQAGPLLIQGLIKDGDKRHAQRVAELEKTVAGLQELLRDRASAAMRLVEINTPADPADRAVIEDVVRRAGNVMEHPEPPSH